MTIAITAERRHGGRDSAGQQRRGGPPRAQRLRLTLCSCYRASSSRRVLRRQTITTNYHNTSGSRRIYIHTSRCLSIHMYTCSVCVYEIPTPIPIHNIPTALVWQNKSRLRHARGGKAVRDCAPPLDYSELRIDSRKLVIV